MFQENIFYHMKREKKQQKQHFYNIQRDIHSIANNTYKIA